VVRWWKVVIVALYNLVLNRDRLLAIGMHISLYSILNHARPLSSLGFCIQGRCETRWRCPKNRLHHYHRSTFIYFRVSCCIYSHSAVKGSALRSLRRIHSAVLEIADDSKHDYPSYVHIDLPRDQETISFEIPRSTLC
jgi:hypothetical protein